MKYKYKKELKKFLKDYIIKKFPVFDEKEIEKYAEEMLDMMSAIMGGYDNIEKAIDKGIEDGYTVEEQFKIMLSIDEKFNGKVNTIKH